MHADMQDSHLHDEVCLPDKHTPGKGPLTCHSCHVGQRFQAVVESADATCSMLQSDTLTASAQQRELDPEDLATA